MLVATRNTFDPSVGDIFATWAGTLVAKFRRAHLQQEPFAFSLNWSWRSSKGGKSVEENAAPKPHATKELDSRTAVAPKVILGPVPAGGAVACAPRMWLFAQLVRAPRLLRENRCGSRVLDC